MSDVQGDAYFRFSLGHPFVGSSVESGNPADLNSGESGGRRLNANAKRKRLDGHRTRPSMPKAAHHRGSAVGTADSISESGCAATPVGPSDAMAAVPVRLSPAAGTNSHSHSSSAGPASPSVVNMPVSQLSPMESRRYLMLRVGSSARLQSC